jgi:hypothetical protein
VGQLTLVEHALCPLDSRTSLAENLVHESAFNYSDKNRLRQTGHVRVLCPLGLSPHDELFLWGCLSLTLTDPQSDGQLVATRHYILRQLGLIDAGSRRGGRQYDDFTAAVERLSAVRYVNDGFYDPIRAEHRRVGFGFFSYSLPVDPESSRAWRIVWDPVFFEFAKAAGGSLRFDLEIYRRLDPAGRRLFLFLTKLFARRQQTYPLDVTSLAVNVLGFSGSMRPSDQKARVSRCIRRLAEQGVVEQRTDAIQRIGVGRYRVVLRKGPAYARYRRMHAQIESPLVEPLRDLGFNESSIGRVLKGFPHPTVREWVDITLAAKERFGAQFFRRTPAAYLMDNLKSSAAGTRTPPDWWYEVRKAEERARADRLRKRRSPDAATDQFPTKAIESVEEVHSTIFQQFRAAGQPDSVARSNAARFRAAHRQRTRPI